MLLALAFIGTVVLGFFGYRAADPKLDAATAFYESLQLFALDGGVVSGGTPWEIEIARFLAPSLIGYAAVRGAMLLAREQVTIWRTRLFAHSHVVVAGGSDAMATIARRLVDSGERVVVVSLDSRLVEGLTETGATVLEGDPRDATVLGRARPDRATDVVIASGTDSDALATLAACQASSPVDGPTIHVALNEPRLWEDLHSVALADAGGRRVEFVLAADREARALLRDVDSQHLVIEGQGVVTERLLKLVARAALIDGRRRLLSLGENAMPVWRAVAEEAPWIAEVLDMAGDLDCLPDSQPFAAIIAGLDDGAAVACGVGLARAHEQSTVRVAVMSDGVGPALRRSGLVPDNLELVPAASIAMGPSLLRETAVELIARAKHADYVARETGRGAPPETNAALVPWEILPPSLRESNLNFAASVATKLQMVGAELKPLTSGDALDDLDLPPALLEALAREEHDRWMRDLLAAGWTKTDGTKDAERRLHPLLVGWEELPEAEREKDRDGFRSLPALLARAGYGLRFPDDTDGGTHR